MSKERANAPGLFVSFEGGEGAGKGTQIARLYRDLQSVYGVENVISTREPGGTEIGEQVRDVLLKGKKDMESKAELMLFFAARAQLLGEIIIPHLEMGHIVLSDRFVDSSTVYQGVARKLGTEFIEQQLAPYIVGTHMPDLTLLFDIDAEQGLSNVTGRGGAQGEVNRLDKQELGFHQSVNRGFRDVASRNPQRYVVVPYRHNGVDRTAAYVRDIFNDLVTRTGYKDSR